MRPIMSRASTIRIEMNDRQCIRVEHIQSLTSTLRLPPPLLPIILRVQARFPDKGVE